MERLTALIKTRLILAGAPAFEAPYLAREAISAARALDFTEERNVVRLAVATFALEPVLRDRPELRDLVVSALLAREVAPSARLDFVERSWLSPRVASGSPR